jgi:ubiquinone/menaquinone biosynthesis C-methylase UbiE
VVLFWRALPLVLVLGLPGRATLRLDVPGQAMLHPARAQALRPTELIARLGIASDATVADVGAGPGWLTLPLARAVPRGRVIATDIRADYLTVAAQRADEAGLDNVEMRVVAADDPGLAGTSIDLALLCQVDAYLPDRARYFARLARSLRAGGRLAIVSQRRHREAVLDAARQAGFTLTDEWAPSPGYVLVVWRRG